MEELFDKNLVWHLSFGAIIYSVRTSIALKSWVKLKIMAAVNL